MQAFKNIDYKRNAIRQWKKSAEEGISGTPTVVMNGFQVTPPNTVQEWENLINPVLPQALDYYKAPTGSKNENY